jgi:hypothetical protein
VSNHRWRKKRTVTITQDGPGVRIENDFGSEEVSDLTLVYALGLRAVAAAIEEQTGVPEDKTISIVAYMAAREMPGMKPSLRHKDDETGEVTDDDEVQR